MTNPNEYAFIQNGNSKGLTKREHMSIEFTKALLSRNIYTRKELNEGGVLDIAETALNQADELIKQLNNEK